MNLSKRIGFWAATLLLGVVLSFGVGEIVVRFFHLAPPLSQQYKGNVPDPYLPYKPKPLSIRTGTSSTGEFEYHLAHNSLGFRDVEHPIDKESGIFRILGLGDSFTYGVGADFNDIYLSRLEKLLNQRAGNHPRVEIIKAGIPRYFPETERILLESYGRQFEPDLILVGFLVNDISDTAKGLDAVVVDSSGYLKSREAAELGDLGVTLYTHSDLLRLVLSSYVNFRMQVRYPTDRREAIKDNGLHEKDWLKVEEEYSRMVATAAEWGGRVVLIHIPQRGPWKPEDSYPAERLAAWAAAGGAAMVDILPAMKNAAEAGEHLYHQKDGHCTAAGHEVIAQVLLGELTRGGLVP